MSTNADTQVEAEEQVQTIETPIQSIPEPMEGFTDNALYNILPARYLKRDGDGEVIEEPEELFERVASNVAEAEFDHVDDPNTLEAQEQYQEWADEFQHLMETQQFMPNSPTLMNADTDLQQLSACFVLEPKDDMDHIFDSARHAALIFKSGGGVGYSFSHLRPQGAIVESTGGVSSGPISFMEVFNTTCGTVEQGGKRRGAQMGILRIDHADIGRFICAKRKEGELDNFNISVGVTDDFKKAVEHGGTYTFFDPESDYEEAFEVVEETANFYNPEFENNPQDWEDAQEDGVSGKLVKENFWRDYADEIMAWDPEAGEKVSVAEKWKDSFTDETETWVVDADGNKEFPLEDAPEDSNPAFTEEVVIEESEYKLREVEEMELPARFVFDLIIDGAWRNGEPGLFYYDETNRDHSFDVEEYPEHAIEATNPCAEQPLSEHEACNLGHINLSLMLNQDAVTYGQWLQNQPDSRISEADTEELVHEYVDKALDNEQFQRVIESGTRFLDNVVTQSEFPLDQISDRVKGQRKIGLGIMGFAQMLFQMGLQYGSDESYEVARAIMHEIDRESKMVSHELAKERGTFKYWDESKYASPTEYPEWFEKHTYEDADDWEGGFKIRNHNTTTIAPTGTTSMLGNTTGGCEPLFNVVNYKNVGDDVQGDDMLVEFDDYFGEVLEENGYDPEEVKAEAQELMATNDFEGPQDLSIPDKIADVFVTTNELTSFQHTDMQRSFQEFTDSGISKTINAPNDATRADVYTSFMRAISDEDQNIGAPAKGLTFYRDGSRNEQVKTVRRDNKLDETDDDIHQTLEDLYKSGEMTAEAAEELGLDVETGEELCEECGTEMEDDGEGCTICPNCFHSPCA